MRPAAAGPPRAVLAGLLLASLALSTPAAAQADAALDVLDGETLYEDGWLVTLGYETETRDQLRSGWHTVPDPNDRRRVRRETVLGVHYGLRHDLQLSLLLPQVQDSRSSTTGGVTTRTAAKGPGDAVALAKWRFHRWDAPHEALNVALLVGAELPTGADRERDNGTLVPADMQPGTGSWDPLLGIAATYEPRRWRFNAAALYKHAGEAHDYRAGDEWLVELAAGHRFWLEPYPGPFMRFDLILRYRNEDRAHQSGMIVHDSGGELTTLGANLAFRPRPALDFQLAVETPISEQVDGTQLGAGTTVTLNFGYRF
jgi:hypothetical protein